MRADIKNPADTGLASHDVKSLAREGPKGAIAGDLEGNLDIALESGSDRRLR